mgnify:CR=1 FL=1
MKKILMIALFSFLSTNVWANKTFKCSVSSWNGTTPFLGEMIVLEIIKGTPPAADKFIFSGEAIGICDQINNDTILDHLDYFTSLYSIGKLGGMKCKKGGTFIAIDRSLFSQNPAGYFSVLDGVNPDIYQCIRSIIVTE